MGICMCTMGHGELSPAIKANGRFRSTGVKGGGNSPPFTMFAIPPRPDKDIMFNAFFLQKPRYP
jgi:hypothetical protein